jgi:hypothetical protein
MLPHLPHRRARRRSISGQMVFLAVGVVLLALIIGGLTQIARQSHSYDVVLNRSLATQGSVVATNSNATGRQLNRVLATMQTQDRSTLQSNLDSVVNQSNDEYMQAVRAGSSQAQMAAPFTSVFFDRAQATFQMRAAIDGLLGMHPLPVAGTPESGGGASTPTLLSSTVATNRIAAAGTLLTRADQVYAGVRQSLRHSAGRGQLPTSVWVTNPQLWQVGSVATQVDLVAASTSLAAVHNLVLRTVRLTPPALPTASGNSTAPSVLTPTHTVSVSVVLSNLGSVDEPQASVQFSLALQPTGAVASQTRTAPVVAGGSVALNPVTFTVKPGSSYLLTVTVVLPAGQASSNGSPLEKLLQIAPGTSSGRP